MRSVLYAFDEEQKLPHSLWLSSGLAGFPKLVEFGERLAIRGLIGWRQVASRASKLVCHTLLL
jgi:hypothetical protein